MSALQVFILNNNEEQDFLATDLSANPEIYASGHACWDNHDNHEFTNEMNNISRWKHTKGWKEQDPNTKRFKQTFIYFDTDTLYANCYILF